MASPTISVAGIPISALFVLLLAAYSCGAGGSAPAKATPTTLTFESYDLYDLTTTTTTGLVPRRSPLPGAPPR